MPDLINFSIVRITNANINVPRWEIEGKIVDSQTQQTVIRDFTGVNSVIFPNVLGNLSSEQQNDFVTKIIQDLIYKRFGIE